MVLIFSVSCGWRCFLIWLGGKAIGTYHSFVYGCAGLLGFQMGQHGWDLLWLWGARAIPLQRIIYFYLGWIGTGLGQVW